MSTPLLQSEGRLVKTSIGLPDNGRIMAVGHFTQERELDLFIRSQDRGSFSIWRWSTRSTKYVKHLEMAVGGGDSKKSILGIVAADFNHDGLLDVLVMTAAEDGEEPASTVEMHLFLHHERELRRADWQIPAMRDQPTIIDYNQDTLIDLFGANARGRPVIYEALPGKDGLTHGYRVVEGPSEMCDLQHPQFSAYADFDGDGLADLLVVCKDGGLEIWRSQAADKNSTGTYFVKGVHVSPTDPVDGPLAVADVDGDGALDVVYYSTKSNAINVLLNQQKRYCTDKESSECKKKDRLFQFDPSYGFHPLPSTTVSMADLFGHTDSWFTGRQEARLVVKDQHGAPMALHVGDLDMDGYPDILVVYETADRSATRPAILKNHKSSHTFGLLKDGLKDFEGITDAESMAFLPFTPNTRLMDIVVQTRSQKMVPLRNTFFRDAFFLQVQVMSNGKCAGSRAKCPRSGQPQPGATFKYAFADSLGLSRVQQGNQYAQSAYLSLPLPFMQLGLGRVSNFIEEAQVALPNKYDATSKRLRHLIPNSRLLIFPPHDGNTNWHVELYINPSDYMLYVGAAAASIITLFALLTSLFKWKEVREDKQEKRRQMYEINYGAL